MVSARGRVWSRAQAWSIEAAGPLLIDVRLFDVYRGAPLGAGDKSLAERLTFQAPDRTLTDAEIDSQLGSITSALARETGARLRT